MYFGGNNGLSKEAEAGLSQLDKEAEINKIIAKGGWKCPNCGKINYSYETTCKCGRGKKRLKDSAYNQYIKIAY